MQFSIDFKSFVNTHTHENWKDIQGYEGLYQININGIVKHPPFNLIYKDDRRYNYKEKILKPSISSNGYYTIALTKNKVCKFYRLHRLLSIAFIPNPDNKPCVNHIDGNKLNNSLSNLEWVTHSENNKHAFAIGLKIPYSNPGIGHFNSKPVACYSKDGEFIKLYGNARVAAKETGATFANISSVCSGTRKFAGGFIWKRLKRQRN